MNERFGSRLFPLLTLTCVLVPVCAGAAAEDACVSAACHTALIQAQHVHPAAESCDSCHESVATPHPQQGNKTFKLSQEPPELCAACHEPFGSKSHMHPPVKDGMCTTCHNPHASNEPKLLTQPIEELCQACHADHVDFEHLHAPVAAGDCTVCHTPHESDGPALLRSPEKETCLGCHDTLITKTMTVLHGPINEGRCTACHDPHGGKNAKFLVREFPAEAYVPYTGAEFALCFGCHKRDMLQDPQTRTATNFRDGERNLHYLHVHNEHKGRSCRLCHGMHGSGNAVLVADGVPFGKWSLPLKFVKTETGGGCAPGCHRPQRYDRAGK